MAAPTSAPSAAAAVVAVGSTNAHRPHHLAHPSISSQRSGGFLAFVDKTIAGIAETRIRPRQSLSRIPTGYDAFVNVPSSPERTLRNPRPVSNYAAPPVGLIPDDGKQPSPTTLVHGDPPSQPYSETDPSHPEPTLVPRLLDNKMHQTSSRLLRMTDDDRPFTKVSPSHGDCRWRSRGKQTPLPSPRRGSALSTHKPFGADSNGCN